MSNEKNEGTRLNVCLLNDSFPPVIDGVANTVLNYATILQKKYGNSFVVTPEYKGAVDNYPFQVYRYASSGITKSWGYRAGVPFSPSAYEEIAQDRIDIIHCHCPMVSAMVARTIRELTGAPMIMTYHTKFDIEIRKALKLEMLAKVGIRTLVENMEAADEVWVVSDGAGKNLRGMGYQGRLRVMENGVDFPRGRVTPAAVAELKGKHAIPADVPVFLFVGRMNWYKGVRISLDALRMLRQNGQDFRMILVGDGLDASEIRQYTKEIGIDDRCIFTGAIRDRELLRAYFCTANLFLFPSTYDTNGIVVREAAACGLGSVLIRGSCAAEGIADGQNGILIAENAESMYRALQSVCRKPEVMSAIGQHAMDEIYISWEDAVDHAYQRYLQIYEWAKGKNLHRSFTPQDEMWKAVAQMYRQSRKVYEISHRKPSLSRRTVHKKLKK